MIILRWNVERFVAHFMKVLGSLTEINQSPEHANNVFPPMDPIVGPQLTSTVFPQSVLMKDLSGLNFPINIHEVTTVLRKVCNGKSTSDMMFMELFKYARVPKQRGGFSKEPLFAPDLCKMFNQCFYDGKGVPDSWLKSYLIPIYKGKGSEFDTDNYRGVAVCSTLYRIYSGILNNRLDDFCEKHSLRAVTQCGFRKRNGTISAIFALSHAIHKSCSSKAQGGLDTPLHVCFVDFKKAFDSAPRLMIWKRLQQLGVHGRFLDAIMDLYRETKFQVKVNGSVSTGFVVTLSGVRQGCPMSPLLFGLFIEQFQAMLAKECPGIGVFSLKGLLLKDITYADDIALMAHSLAELQLLIDCLKRFCAEVGMEVNVDKTKGMICSRPRAGPRVCLSALIYDSKSIDYQKFFVYLGIHFDQNKWLKNSVDYTTVAARRAMWALIRRMQELGIMCLDTKIRLFKSLVLSIGNYGCQVWGPPLLMPSQSCTFKNPMQILILEFIRIISGCGRKTSRWILLREFDMWPVQAQWARLCVKFWNKIILSINEGEDSIENVALIADLDLFKKGNKVCWSFQFLKAICHLGLITDSISISALSCWDMDRLLSMSFSEKSVENAYIKCYENMKPQLKITSSSPLEVYLPGEEGRGLYKYMKYFHDDKFTTLKASVPEVYLRNGMCFRTGSIQFKDNDYKLKSRNNLCHRFCSLCDLGVVEDEQHVIFQCPFYNDLREDQRWAHLFNKVMGGMNIFMSQRRQPEVYEFLFRVVRRRFPVSNCPPRAIP